MKFSDLKFLSSVLFSSDRNGKPTKNECQQQDTRQEVEFYSEPAVNFNNISSRR